MRSPIALLRISAFVNRSAVRYLDGGQTISSRHCGSIPALQVMQIALCSSSASLIAFRIREIPAISEIVSTSLTWFSLVSDHATSSTATGRHANDSHAWSRPSSDVLMPHHEKGPTSPATVDTQEVMLMGAPHGMRCVPTAYPSKAY